MAAVLIAAAADHRKETFAKLAHKQTGKQTTRCMACKQGQEQMRPSWRTMHNSSCLQAAGGACCLVALAAAHQQLLSGTVTSGST
jgi:hypothetical protein